MNGGTSPKSSDAVEMIVMQLSSKEAEQQLKRERCSQIVDSINEYQDRIKRLRKEVQQTQEELQILDDDIEDLQRERNRIVGYDLDNQTQYPMNLTQTQFKDEEEVKHTTTMKEAPERDIRLQNPPQQQKVRETDVRNKGTYHRNVNDDDTDLDNPNQINLYQGSKDVDGFLSSNKSSSFENGSRERLSENGGIHVSDSMLATSSNGRCDLASTSGKARSGTLEDYFDISRPKSEQQNPQGDASNASIFPSHLQQYFKHSNKKDAANDASAFHHTAHRGLHESLRGRNPGRINQDYRKQLSSDGFPWSQQLQHELMNTFNLKEFRGDQKEIINSTMSGDDVFVIMRTGGGKSLTYQLPALIEGLGKERKVTFVVSPLLSLIQDQEEQMNQYSTGTATSFTSGVGIAEQKRRWNLIRDRNSGICLVFLTPERIYKSSKVKSELEKLNNQNRLARFVIDECHCATQWGHDFRNDYTKLGILKQHFPQTPMLAVTATASNKVREDCCKILRLGEYQFFRSSASRPNLKYSIKMKPEKAVAVVELMADYIREHHHHNSGIIYCFSKKEANSVAEKLSNLGITARAYHAEVSASAKDSIHRSWMKNRTQVVVATIAFGLGINKPNVRFVLHHSLSKTLEAYYQESGRAGRDGKEADCILYYSPKDVCRTLSMIHGERTESLFWSMARYAQMHGDDSLCKRIIMSTLGEPGSEQIADVLNSEAANSTTQPREVTRFAKDVIRIIHESSKAMTMAQIVTMWRSPNGKNTPAFVKDNPPNLELTRDECERIICSLMISNILYPNVKFTAYNNIVYIGLKPQALQLLDSPNSQVTIRFPKRKNNLKSATKCKSAPRLEDGEVTWMSSKKKKVSAKKAPKQKRKKTKAMEQKQHVSEKNRNFKSKKKLSKKSKNNFEVIDILDDSDDDNSIEDIMSRTQSQTNTGISKRKSVLLDDLESDSDNE